MVTRLVVSTRSSQPHAHPMSRSPSPRFVSSPGSRYDYYMAWLYNPVLAVLPDYSSNVLAEYRVSRGGLQVLFFSSGGFPAVCYGCFGVRRRSSHAYFLEGFSLYAFHPFSSPVLLPGCFVPHVFPVRRGFPGSISYVNRYTHRRAGRELGGGSCWLSDLTPYVNAVLQPHRTPVCRRLS